MEQHDNKKLIEQLKQEIDSALNHVVGMSYWNEVAQEKNEQIKKLTKEETKHKGGIC